MNALRMGAVSLLFPFSAALAIPPEIDVIPAAPHFDRLTQQKNSNHSAGKVIAVNNAQLAKQPELGKVFLNQAVRDGDWLIVEAILPVYETTTNADNTLIRFAKAGLARSKGNYELAITHYRAILSEHPELDAVRLDMAVTMYENHQYDISEYHFRRVLQGSPPENIREIIAYYIERVQQGHDVTGSLSFSYLNESNVNNASSGKTIRVGDRLFLRNKDSFPQRGEGLWFNGVLQKDVPIYNQHSLRFMGAVNGKSYWSNHNFDDVTSRIYAGYQWRNYRHQFSLLPFYEKRWYSTETFSSGPGLRTEYSYLISPAWQISQAFEYQKLNYDADKYHFLRGRTSYSSTTLSHAFSNVLSAYVGVDFQDQQTTSKSETNHRSAVRGGVQMDLSWKLSFAASTAFAKREYQANSEIFGTRRKDNEQFYNLSLWQRDLSVFGMMPKLNFTYKRVNSNIDFYAYDQRNITLSVDKIF